MTDATQLSESTTQWMMKNGFDPLQPAQTAKHQDTALMAACRHGEENIALDLLRLPADVIGLNHRNMDGTNALWAAVVANNFFLADNLLAAGIDINNLNDNGASTLMYASSAGKTRWVSYLLDMGADTRAETLDGFSALDLAANIDCLRLMRRAVQSATA